MEPELCKTGMQSLRGEACPAPMEGRILKDLCSQAFTGLTSLGFIENTKLIAWHLCGQALGACALFSGARENKV